MWIPKSVWTSVKAHLEEAVGRGDERELDVSALDGRLLQLQEECNRLRERLITAEGDARSHQAYADVWRLQVNTLTEQNAALLTQLVPTLTVKVPKIERDSQVFPAGLDFEDMGDAAAQLMGLADAFPVDPSPAPPLGPVPEGRIVPGTPRPPTA